MNETLKEYIGDVDLTNYKYLNVVFDEVAGCGLLDQTFQLKMYLKIAYELGLILILPKRNLAKKHNGGVEIPLIFSDYYDIDSIKVNGVAVDVAVTPVDCPSSEVLKINSIKREAGIDIFKKVSQELNYKVVIVACKDDVELGREFVEINKIEGCVHIRRTDRCRRGHLNRGVSGKEWDIANRPDNILALLDSTNAPKNIYIMTDMPSDDSIIEELRRIKKYNFMFLYDFPEMIEIKNKNNYKVFNIETCIMAATLYKKHMGNVVEFYMRNK